MNKCLLICNPDWKGLFNNSNYKIICNSDDLKSELNKSFFSFKALVVLTELSWDIDGKSCKLQNCYGIKLIKILRLEYKIKLPVLFLSLEEIDFYLEKGDNDIMNFCGHSYCKFPSTPEEWDLKINEILPVTDMQLDDISINMCTLRGIVDNLLHNMKWKMNKNIIGYIDKLKIIFSFNADALNIISNLNKMIGDKPDNIYEGSFNSLLLSYTSASNEKDIPPTSKRNWGLLVLEDEIDTIKNFISILKNKGITNIITTAEVKIAENIIKEDKENNICVVIADYRLYEPGRNNKKTQPKQGYDFLVELAKSDRFNTLVALSSLSKLTLLNSFRNYNTRVKVFSKDDLLDTTGANILAEEILSYGDETFESLMSLPSKESWNKQTRNPEWISIKPFYICFRNAANYNETERYISETAKLIISQVEYIISYNNDELKLISYITKIKDGTLTAKMGNKSATNLRDFEVFVNKMIARRVFFCLYFMKGLDVKTITAILKYGNFDISNINKSDVNSVKNTNAITLEDFPANILIEEKNWFKYYMNEDINNLKDIISQISYYFQTMLNEYFNKSVLEIKGIKEFLIEDKIILNSQQDIKRFINAIFSTPNTKKSNLIEFIEQKIIPEISKDSYCSEYLVSITDLLKNIKSTIIKK